MKPQSRIMVLAVASLVASCGSAADQPRKLTVAAASNLKGVFDEIAAAFRAKTGVAVVLSYGSTAQLTQQIENGAPFDVFAAADTEHVDQLIAAGKLAKDSRAVYARGQLALWAPEGENLSVHTLADLTKPEVHFIAIAQPDLAPYGQAAVEAMKAAGLWDALRPKLVYANNINLARQFAATGNAEAAFTAYSLVSKDAGLVIKVPLELYLPIDQALAVVASSPENELARQFATFVTGPESRAILGGTGYGLP
jgi:molybdate transport system substrate-binding protein